MNEEKLSSENTGSTVVAKITGIFDTMNAGIDKAFDFLTDHPWADWIKIGEKFIVKYLPFLVVVLGFWAFLSTFIIAVCCEMPFGDTLKYLAGFVLLTVFVLYLLPKTITLITSLHDNREDEAVRPQVLGALKAVGLLFGASLLMAPYCDPAAFSVAIGLSLVLIILASNPKIMGVKAACPQSFAEELITICLLPYKIFISFFAYIITLVALGGLGYGLSIICEYGFDSYESEMAISTFSGTLVLLVSLPLIVYFLYLSVNFFAEIVRAIVALPKKLDELRNK